MFTLFCLFFQSLCLDGAFFKAVGAVYFSASRFVTSVVYGAGFGGWGLTAVDRLLTLYPEFNVQ